MAGLRLGPNVSELVVNCAAAGTIAPGMLADLTVIDCDLRVIPAAEIREAKIARTIVAGKTAFQ